MQEWKPRGTYGLLIAIAVVYMLEMLTLRTPAALQFFSTLYVIDTGWYVKPWVLVTSTLAHGSFGHLFGNAIFLYFLAPTVERLVGTRRFVILFLIGGAVAGLFQVYLESYLYGGDGGALGASGGLMMVMGILVVLLPRQKVYLLFPPIPIPMWALGAFYVTLDLVGALNPADGIGNFAHLSGLAFGALFAVWFKRDMAERGARIYTG